MEKGFKKLKVEENSELPTMEKLPIFIQSLFCPGCLKIPEYSIHITKDEKVLLRHLCIRISKEKILFENDEFQSFIANNSCSYCNIKCENICLKCDKNVCNKCSENHLINPLIYPNYEKIKQSLDKSIIYIPIAQFYCKEHLSKNSYFCGICKINLCHECKLEHCHINCLSLLEEKTTEQIVKYNGSNKIILELLKISKLLKECYLELLKNSNMTLSILLNLFLSNEINEFIKSRINQTNKINDRKEQFIKNKYLETIKISNHLCQIYGGTNFQYNYFQVIHFIRTGNIRSYHNFNKIKEAYKEPFLPLFELNLKSAYIIGLENLIKNSYTDLLLISNSIEIGKTYYFILETIKKNQELQLIINKLNLDIQVLKAYIVGIDYRVDYELRRKIGNLIAVKIISLYPNLIDKIIETEYLFGLSIEFLEKKIKKIQSQTLEIDEVKKKTLIDKYSKGLELLNKLSSNKLENIKNANNNIELIQIPIGNTNIQFKDDKDNELLNIILNLFFIVRKKLNELINLDIHNKAVKINYLIKEEISNFEKEKKIHKESDIKKIAENIEERKPKSKRIDIIKSDYILNKICKKNQILKIKQNIQVKKLLSEKYEAILKEIVIDPTPSELNEHLKDLVNNIYDVNSDLNLLNALDLYTEGEKSNLLEEGLINSDNASTFNRSEHYKDKEKIVKLLNESSQKDSIQAIKIYLENILDTINNKLSYLYNVQFKSIEYIKDYGEFFNINETLQTLKINTPLNPYDTIENIKDGLKNNFDEDYYEKSFFMIQICMFFYLEEHINYLYKIKEKIIDINIEEKIKLNEVKDKLIKEFKSKITYKNVTENLMEKVWSSLKEENQLIVSNKILNSKIVDYVLKNNATKFKKDLIKLCGASFKEISLNNPDPQNLFLAPFMKQYGLDFDI